jgi:hypothetical protein
MAKHERFVEESSATPSCTYRHSGTFANYKIVLRGVLKTTTGAQKRISVDAPLLSHSHIQMPCRNKSKPDVSSSSSTKGKGRGKMVPTTGAPTMSYNVPLSSPSQYLSPDTSPIPYPSNQAPSNSKGKSKGKGKENLDPTTDSPTTPSQSLSPDTSSRPSPSNQALSNPKGKSKGEGKLDPTTDHPTLSPSDD